MSGHSRQYRDQRAARSQSSPPRDRPRELTPLSPSETPAISAPIPRLAAAAEGFASPRPTPAPPSRTPSRASGSTARARYSTVIPDMSRPTSVIPPASPTPSSRKGDEGDEVSLGGGDDDERMRSESAEPRSWNEFETSTGRVDDDDWGLGADGAGQPALETPDLGGQGGGAEGSYPRPPLTPPRPSSSQPTSIEGAVQTLNDLGTWFILTRPPTSSDMDDGSTESLGMALECLVTNIQGSQWGPYFDARRGGPHTIWSRFT